MLRQWTKCKNIKIIHVGVSLEKINKIYIYNGNDSSVRHVIPLKCSVQTFQLIFKNNSNCTNKQTLIYIYMTGFTYIYTNITLYKYHSWNYK